MMKKLLKFIVDKLEHIFSRVIAPFYLIFFKVNICTLIVF